MILPNFIAATPRHFGLSIGRTSLRAVEIDVHHQVRASAEVLLPEGVFIEGILIKKDVFVTALKQLLSIGKFSTPYVAVCFSEAHAYSREYSLPKIPIDEIQEAIGWHVKDLFPIAADDIYFDWLLLDDTGAEQKVTVVAVQKKLIDPLVEVLIASGLKPLGFEPGAAAISRLLTLKSGQYAILTEINRKGAYVTLIGEKNILFTTVVNFTTEDTPQTYLKTITQTTHEVIDYFKQKNVITENSIITVVLTGELAGESITQSFKTEMSSYPVTILTTPLKNPAFNKAYAVAAFSVAPPQDPLSINMLPIEIQKQYDTEHKEHFYKSLFVKTCLVLSFILAGSLTVFLGVTLKKQQIEARTKSINDKTKTLTANTQSLLLLNAQASDIVTFAPLRITPKHKLEVLTSVLPTSIAVTDWEYDDSRLLFTLNGIAQKREDLLTFKDKLEQTQEFEKVTLPLGSLEAPVNVRFTITFVSKN